MNAQLKQSGQPESDNDRVDQGIRAMCAIVLGFIWVSGDYSATTKLTELLERAIGNDRSSQTEAAEMLRRELHALSRSMSTPPLEALRWLLTK
jgi:hypothetical protein